MLPKFLYVELLLTRKYLPIAFIYQLLQINLHTQERFTYVFDIPISGMLECYRKANTSQLLSIFNLDIETVA